MLVSAGSGLAVTMAGGYRAGVWLFFLLVAMNGDHLHLAAGPGGRGLDARCSFPALHEHSGSVCLGRR